MKETATSERGIGFVEANRSGIKNYGEEKIIGHTEEGEGDSLRVQRADVKKALGSVHKMNSGGNVIALYGDKSFMQNMGTSKTTRITHWQSPYVTHVWALVKEGEVAKETEKVLNGNRFAILATESEVQQGFTRRAEAP